MPATDSTTSPVASTPSSTDGREFRIRSLIWTVYAPSFLLSIGTGLLVPIVPLFARDLGASVGLAAFAVGARELGTVLFDLPVGTLVARFGRRRTMIAGTIAILVLSLLTGLTTMIWQFIALRFLIGGAMALWSISRHTYIADTVPVQHRGRALSLFGGMGRLGTFIGPIIGGFVGEHFGLGVPFFVQSGFALITLGLVVVLMKEGQEQPNVRPTRNAYARIGSTLTEHRRAFLTAGVAAMALQLVRNARQVMIPLWGSEIGLGAGDIGLAIGIAAAVDMLFFYPAGLLMDRFGRKFAIVPSLLVISSALALMPLTTSFWGLLCVAVLAGIGNGLSSGAVLTLGADLAPRQGWRIPGCLALLHGHRWNDCAFCDRRGCLRRFAGRRRPRHRRDGRVRGGLDVGPLPGDPDEDRSGQTLGLSDPRVEATLRA